MRYAQIDSPSGERRVEENSVVSNIVVFDHTLTKEEINEWPVFLIPAGALGLEIGDLYNGAEWTRNVDGEQVFLPIEKDSADAEEMLAILRGEVE